MEMQVYITGRGFGLASWSRVLCRVAICDQRVFFVAAMELCLRVTCACSAAAAGQQASSSGVLSSGSAAQSRVG